MVATLHWWEKLQFFLIDQKEWSTCWFDSAGYKTTVSSTRPKELPYISRKLGCNG